MRTLRLESGLSHRGGGEICPLSAGGEGREIDVEGENRFVGVQWAGDGKGLFVGADKGQTNQALFVDLQGDANVLWQRWFPLTYESWYIPSSDGRHLALLGYTADNNVWMLENF